MASNFRPEVNGYPSRKPEAIRVVNDKIFSLKRGVCLNETLQADFAALSPGVRWYYNWDCRPQEHGRTADLQFVPMVWGEHPLALRRLDQYLASTTPKPPVVFAINEPNLRRQAFLTPRQTAELYRKVKSVTDTYHVPLVGPHMALGSAEDDSITALDPVEEKIVTYTSMIPFLKAVFFHLKESGITPPAIGIHTYGGVGEIKWAIEIAHAEFGCPVWLTEFANWQCDDLAQARDFLLEAVDYLEKSPIVAGYAWFKDRVPGKPCASLLLEAPGKLSIIGKAYVSVPPHDDAGHL